MIIGEAIQRVQSVYSKGASSDDSRLSNRHVYSKLRSSRVRIISQVINKNQIVSQWCYQPIYVKMVQAGKHDCADITTATCKVLKSTKPIPQIFTDMDKHLIQSVTTIDASQGFGFTTWEDIRFRKGRKYTTDIPECYIKDGYLYIVDRKVCDLIILTALFNDPIEAKNYSNSCGGEYQTCKSYLDYDFAIDGKLEEVIIDMTNAEFIYNFSQTRDDRTNNATDDVTTPQKRYNQNQNQNFNE
jgi:hypothetical protein